MIKRESMDAKNKLFWTTAQELYSSCQPAFFPRLFVCLFECGPIAYHSNICVKGKPSFS